MTPFILGDAFYLMAGLAAVSAEGLLLARANQTQTVKTSFAVGATISADATPLGAFPPGNFFG